MSDRWTKKSIPVPPDLRWGDDRSVVYKPCGIFEAPYPRAFDEPLIVMALAKLVPDRDPIETLENIRCADPVTYYGFSVPVEEWGRA